MKARENRDLARQAVIRELLLWAILALGLWALFAHLDMFEVLADFSQAYEEYELDELLLAVVVTGGFGFWFALRRYSEVIVERRRRLAAERSTAWLGNHDVLTGLPNRKFLAEFGRQMQGGHLAEPAGRYLVITIDLNGFKQVNDLFGQAVGDALLVEVVARIKGVVPDDLVVRTGGDEFCIVIRRAETTSPGAICGRLMGDICKPMDVGDASAMVGASFGYSSFPDDSTSFHEVVTFSSTAMFVAKRGPHGKERVRISAFRPHMREIVTRGARLERNLRLAVRDGLITPHYQPLIDLVTGRLYGFEVLARWCDGDHGFVPPDEFIRAADELGLIDELSEQLLTKACRDACAWALPKTIAFNFSPSQFGNERIVDDVKRILEETGLPAARLEIEITESAVIQSMGSARTIIEQFNHHGVRVSLDDFGTGYSNLAKLSRLPFGRLKIDRSFVADMTKGERPLHVVKAVLALGRGLGMLVTAEGIEHENEASMLRLHGCDSGQGYFFGKAMPNADVIRLLAAELGNGRSAPDAVSESHASTRKGVQSNCTQTGAHGWLDADVV